jgi:hypothetical protein
VSSFLFLENIQGNGKTTHTQLGVVYSIYLVHEASMMFNPHMMKAPWEKSWGQAGWTGHPAPLSACLANCDGYASLSYYYTQKCLLFPLLCFRKGKCKTYSNFNFTNQSGQGSLGTGNICPDDPSLLQTLDINLLATFTRPPLTVTSIYVESIMH